MSCIPVILPEVEEVDAHLEFVFDGGDLVVGHRISDLIETLFCEEAVVPKWALAVCGARMEGRQDRISKASVVLVLDVDDCMLLLEEGRELPEFETRER